VRTIPIPRTPCLHASVKPPEDLRVDIEFDAKHKFFVLVLRFHAFWRELPRQRQS
jgi:hypothetical protein